MINIKISFRNYIRSRERHESIVSLPSFRQIQGHPWLDNQPGKNKVEVLSPATVIRNSFFKFLGTGPSCTFISRSLFTAKAGLLEPRPPKGKKKDQTTKSVIWEHRTLYPYTIYLHPSTICSQSYKTCFTPFIRDLVSRCRRI